MSGCLLLYPWLNLTAIDWEVAVTERICVSGSDLLIVSPVGEVRWSEVDQLKAVVVYGDGLVCSPDIVATNWNADVLDIAGFVHVQG